MGKEKILVVEDTAIIALDIRNSLEQLGYEIVGIVATGTDAVSTALLHQPDLILMDIGLKGDMDGIDAAIIIKKFIDAPIVFLTSYTDENTLERAKAVKPQGYLSKPFDKQTVYSTIELALYKQELDQSFREHKEWLATILRSIGDAVVATDEQGIVTFTNPVAQNLTKWKEEEALGKQLQQVFTTIDEETQHPTADPVMHVIMEGATFCPINKIVLINKLGEHLPIDMTMAPIKNISGKIVGTVIIFRDSSERRIAEQKIRYLSFHDKLTGLYNRAYFEEQLKQLDTERQLPISIIMGDVNNLKLTNDAFGHYEGDKLLVSAAEVIKNTCRQEDVVARWAGDEFTILLPKTEEKIAWTICERITKGCDNIPADPIKPSIALGAACKNRSEQRLNDVIKEAEDRMYRHKLLNMKEVRNSVIASLVRTLEERQVESEGHCWRIQHLAVELGYAMRLSDWLLDDLVLAVTLHDIGKIAISSEILNKPGKLNAEEMEIMKTYPEKGYRLIGVSDELAHIAPIILTVQECWDGSGYPQGLKEEEIPLLSRIIRVIHTYELLTNERVYCQAVSQEEALAELEKCSGTQFDPVVIREFIKLSKGW